MKVGVVIITAINDDDDDDDDDDDNNDDDDDNIDDDNNDMLLMPPLHRDTSELGVVPCGKEIWTRPHGTTRGEKRHTGTPRVS